MILRHHYSHELLHDAANDYDTRIRSVNHMHLSNVTSFP